MDGFVYAPVEVVSNADHDLRVGLTYAPVDAVSYRDGLNAGCWTKEPIEEVSRADHDWAGEGRVNAPVEEVSITENLGCVGYIRACMAGWVYAPVEAVSKADHDLRVGEDT